MELLGLIITVIFTALLLAGAMMFGVILLAWFAGMGLLLGLYVLLTRGWMRWQFLRTGQKPPDTMKVIDVDYRDITPK